MSKQANTNLITNTPLAVVTLRADCVDLVDEDDGRGMVLGHAEQLAHELWAVSEVLLNQLGAHHAQESRTNV